jgi:hypothetical protein
VEGDVDRYQDILVGCGHISEWFQEDVEWRNSIVRHDRLSVDPKGSRNHAYRHSGP